MKRILLLINFFLIVFSCTYADEIPYNLLTDRIVEKLQKFGLNGIHYYSYHLYGSDDRESLIKTKEIITSFKANHEACGEFLYYWWYMWVPMPERGFIENVYMTHAEAYDCCEIGEAIHKKKTIERTQKQKENYELWKKNGAPSTVTPSEYAVISTSASKDLADYVSINRVNGKYEKKFTIKIDAKGIVSVDSKNEIEQKITELLNIKVEKPAIYEFDEIDKSIPVDSYMNLYLEANSYSSSDALPFDMLDRIHDMAHIYEASVKYDKNALDWEIKIDKYCKKTFEEVTGAHLDEYITAIKKALSSSHNAPKKHIRFMFEESYLKIKYSSNKKEEKTAESIRLAPIAIILD